jgi:16S rRNA (guanine966-N2)-methyltransferase
VREAIFNILDARAEPPDRVLDLYAGSGALGLEALSRGAGSAFFVDADDDACDLVRANADALGLPANVVNSPVVRWLSKMATGQYGWIFLDPPYDSHQTGELDKALGFVAKKQLLAPGGLAIAEHEWRHPPADSFVGASAAQGSLALFDRRRYGQTTVSFYRREEDNG